MSKCLPIDESSIFRSYTYYSFMHAIINNEYRTGNVAAILKILGDYDWKSVISPTLIMEKSDDVFVFKTDKFNLKMNGCVYRDLNTIDEQEVEIDYKQFSGAYGEVGIVVADNTDFSEDMNFDCAFTVMNRCDLRFLEGPGREKIYRFRHSEKDKIKIKSSREECTFYIQDNNGEYVEICKFTYKTEASRYLGVFIRLDDNSYYDWLFQNHVQLKYNKGESFIKLEFDLMLKKEWKYFTTNYFIDYNVEKIDFLLDMDVDIFEYITHKIDNDIYVEIDLDSYDIPETKYFGKKNVKHTCLVYGYDDEEKNLLLISVEGGISKKGTIQYDLFNNQMKLNKIKKSENNNMIISHIYNPDPYTPHFSIQRFAKDLRSYLKSNTVFDTELILPIDTYCYGMEIYKHLINDKEGQIFLNDVRMASVIVEHKDCMASRIEYIYRKGFIDQNQYEQLNELASYILKCSRIIENYVVRYEYLIGKKCNDKTDLSSIKNSEKMIEKSKKMVFHNLRVLKIAEGVLYHAILRIIDSENEVIENIDNKVIKDGSKMDSYRSKLKDIVLNVTENVVNIDEIDGDSNLKEYGLGSIGFVAILVAIEEEMGIEVEMEDFVYENFNTINKLINYVSLNV